MVDSRMSVAQLITQRKAIVEVMEKTMTRDIDYGIIPGTPKPTLYKPGSEKILAIFHLGVKPSIEDLSTPDCIRYRVHIEVFHQPTGNSLGEGIGEASSAEAKYQWREVVCEEEWQATPEDRRRVKWKKGRPNPYSVRQVRADMEDVANTILKMAKKRAQIDAVLTATAASDIFSQDLEDLKDAGFEPTDDSGPVTPASVTQQQPATQQELPRKEAAAQPAQHSAASTAAAAARPSAATITPEQGKRFWAIAMTRVNDYKKIQDYLKSVHGVTRKDDIMAIRYDEAIKWAETGAVE